MSTSRKRENPDNQKGKRGRPALKIQKTKDTFDQSHSMRSVMENYDATRLSYECTLFTQQLCLMLQRIASSPPLRSFLKEPVYQYLEKTVKDVMLTELEVAVWSIVLARTEREMRETDLMLYLRVTAFGVRRATEGEILLSDIEAYLDMKPGFQRHFTKWFEKNKEALDIPLFEVNETYQRLTQPLGLQDAEQYIYSYNIDEVIDEPVLSDDNVQEEEEKMGFLIKREERHRESQAFRSTNLASGLAIDRSLSAMMSTGRPQSFGSGQFLLPSLSSMSSVDRLESTESYKESEKPRFDPKLES